MIIFFLVTAVSFWISIAVSDNYAHGLSHAGWFILVGLIPAICQIRGLIELGFLAGDPGHHLYGEASKAPNPARITLAQPVQ